MAATLLKRPGVVSAAEHGPMTSLRRFTTGFRLAWLALLRFARLPTERARRGTLHGLETIEIFLGGFGLVAALVAAALLSPALGALPGAAGDFAPVGMAILLAPIGITVALGRRVEIERFFRSLSERTEAITTTPTPQADTSFPPVVVDTSAIIDGRLAELVDSGFLLANLLVPRFILDELRRVADSSDPVKRQRGRRGMEILTTIQVSDTITTQIDEELFSGAGDVDSRLVALARARRAAILTTDFNLARIAQLESIRVLNPNVLSQALRVVLVPGEQLEITIHQEGRERRQGLGYLEDGTMVVVEEARNRQNETVTVEVMRSIQTSAGRMIFARMIEGENVGNLPAESADDQIDATVAQKANEQTGTLSQ